MPPTPPTPNADAGSCNLCQPSPPPSHTPINHMHRAGLTHIARSSTSPPEPWAHARLPHHTTISYLRFLAIRVHTQSSEQYSYTNATYLSVHLSRSLSEVFVLWLRWIAQKHREKRRRGALTIFHTAESSSPVSQHTHHTASQTQITVHRQNTPETHSFY